MSLRTRLVSGNAMVDMVEHVLAALYALKIDNVEVHCNQAEMPDWTAVVMLTCSPSKRLDALNRKTERATHVITQPMRVGDESQWVVAYPAPPSHGLTIEYQLDYGPSSAIKACAYTCPVNEFTFVNELGRRAHVPHKSRKLSICKAKVSPSMLPRVTCWSLVMTGRSITGCVIPMNALDTRRSTCWVTWRCQVSTWWAGSSLIAAVIN